jgi:hypothetical protein
VRYRTWPSAGLTQSAESHVRVELEAWREVDDAQSNLEQSKPDANLITLCKVGGGGWESTYAKHDSLH